MMDNEDQWGRLRPTQESQILKIKDKFIIQKREMGKLGSRLGALEVSEFEAMILSDVEKMHNDNDALEGISNEV